MLTPHEAPRLKFTSVSTLLFVSLVVLASGCAKGKAGAGFQMPPTPVEVAEVQVQTVRDQFRALGSIASQDQIEVVSELSAVVVDLPFAEGQTVPAGGLIARLDDREYRAENERAVAVLNQARANFQRAKKLIEQKAISEQSLEDATMALKVADASASLTRARFDKTRVRAPFTGIAGRRRVSRGAYVKAGDVLTDLARVDQMKVSFAAPERYLGQLRVGVPVEVSTPAYPHQPFPGRISVVDPMIDPQTRTVQLLAIIPNRQRMLRPGMSANLSVTFAERAGSLVVPDEAIFAEGNQSFVFVVGDSNKVQRVAVQLGSRDSTRVEILSGLTAGQKIVRAGHQKLFPGAKVQPVGAGAQTAAAPGAGS